MNEDFWLDMKRMQKRMNRLFDPWSDDDFEAEQNDHRRAWTDFRETESEFLIAVELPGIEKEDIQPEVVGRNLAIKAQLKKEKEQKKEGSFSYASSYAGFMRTMPLPENTDAEKISAEFKNGVLMVHVPKKKI